MSVSMVILTSFAGSLAGEIASESTLKNTQIVLIFQIYNIFLFIYSKDDYFRGFWKKVSHILPRVMSQHETLYVENNLDFV